MEKPTLTFGINQKSHQLTSLDLQTQIAGEDLSRLGFGSLLQGRHNLSLKWELKKAAPETDFKAPPENEVASLGSSVELFETVSGKKISEDPLELLLLGGQTAEYGANLLTIASLQRVFLLFPTADLISF
jgi:hypothetical protein